MGHLFLFVIQYLNERQHILKLKNCIKGDLIGVQYYVQTRKQISSFICDHLSVLQAQVSQKSPFGDLPL